MLASCCSLTSLAASRVQRRVHLQAWMVRQMPQALGTLAQRGMRTLVSATAAAARILMGLWAAPPPQAATASRCEASLSKL